MITWPIWWLILKSPSQGAQSYLMAAMDPGISAAAINAAAAAEKMGVDIDDEQRKNLIFSGRGVAGGKIIKDCRERDVLRAEMMDLQAGKALWDFSEKQIEQKEKEGAVLRALEKQEQAARQTQEKKETGLSQKPEKESSESSAKEHKPGSRRSRKIR